MTKPTLHLLLVAVLFPALLQAASPSISMPSSIEVFTNGRHPISGATSASVPVQIYDLDAPDRLEDALSADLPPDPEQAKTIALKRLNNLGPELADMVNQAYEGVAKAMSYELTKIPAVVFDDGASVIYGISDINEAIKLYQAWQQEMAQ